MDDVFPSMDDPLDDASAMSLCTRAITGPARPAHQSIFVCDTCQLFDGGASAEKNNGPDDVDDKRGEPLPSCICQSCAYACHAGHEVYFVGVGPCTCDCPSMVGREEEAGAQSECGLAEHSAREARRLGFDELRLLNCPIPMKVPPMLVPALDENGADGEAGKVEEAEPGDADAAGEGSLSQLMTNLCIDCNSSLGGYTYASFTLPGLSNDDGDELCQNLIRQAEALTSCSHETFWVPDDVADEEAGGDEKWCDLEILARQIYRRHAESYSLDAADDDDANAPNTASSNGGAEWWVQVKPAGTSRAPVDLHYDKDEILAERFGLGSFPTLSTVTYLTGEKDNQPTVVFPHTYHDEEDRPIEAMLLSHAERAKHLVFDGRLLHGAPAHPALRRQGSTDQGNTQSIAEDEEEEGRTLRVTFLVNVWKSGRPAGVDILPESIRAKIRAAAMDASLQTAKPLEFRERRVSKSRVSPEASTARSGGKIVLPFVSHGATWIDGDDNVADEEEGGEADSEGEEVDGEGSDSAQYDQDGDDDSEDEEDDELVLVLPPLAPAEDLQDEADTIVFTFEGGNRARLVREGALDEGTAPDCPWKKLAAAGDESEVSDDGERGSTAAQFLSNLNDTLPSFVATIIAELERQCNIDVTDLQADHVCYRTDSVEQYHSVVDALKSAGADIATLLVESDVGGRPIATFKLSNPIEIESTNGHRTIDVIEIPSPKEGSPYTAGLEHVEFVIGDGSCISPLNDEVHERALKAWMGKHSSVPWSAKALNKHCNPDVSTKLEIGNYGTVSVKFHLIPLEDVIKFEKGE